MAGALEGLTVVEFAGIGPVPFAGMMLADHGARVVRIERAELATRYGYAMQHDILSRSHETLDLDLKQPAAVVQVRELVRDADALIEGYRPGVMERLGLGPELLLRDHPRLVYGRMTGWGQAGPKAQLPGHDIDYIALAGALHTYGPTDKPAFPVNAVGDYGGGGMMLAFGVLAGILSAQRTGAGQVIDCAMVDGAAVLSAMTWSLYGSGLWHDARGANILDGGAPFYDTYETADGKWLAVGAIEEPFYAALVERLGVAGDPDFAGQGDPARWPALRDRFAALFRTRTRDAWCALLEDSQACVAPVLSLAEAPRHPHNVARGTFLENDGVVQPAPAPRFSRTPAPRPRWSVQADLPRGTKPGQP